MAVRVAIIGGGWSGLACAEALLRGQPGWQVALFEAAPQLGGRARGLAWPDVQNPVRPPIDNGQHLLLGAHRETLALVTRCRTAPRRPAQPREGAWLGRSRFHWQLVGQPGRAPDAELTLAHAGFPLRLPASILGLRHWPLGWTLALARLTSSLVRTHWTVPAGFSVADWLELTRQPLGLQEALWRPMAESALTTDWREANAQSFVALLQESLAGPRGSLSLAHPRLDLSADLIEPMAEGLREMGLQIHRRHRVAQLHQNSSGRWRLSCGQTAPAQPSADPEAGFDAVVLALPAQASLRLWQASGLMPTQSSQRWARRSPRGILTAMAWIRPEQCQRRSAAWKAWGGGQLGIARLPELLSTGPVMRLARPAGPWGQVISYVLSATQTGPEHPDSPSLKAALRQMVQADLGPVLGPELGPEGLGPDQLWLHHDRQACWACTTDFEWDRPDTGLAGLWRAGDDGLAPLPGTIETAVRSGQQTAQALMLDQALLR